MNDRALRPAGTSPGGCSNVYPREAGFDITVASEIMAILCLATSIEDLEESIGNIIVGYRRDKSAVTARDIKAHGAMAVLLKDAIQPNLVQTLENNPAFIHGGRSDEHTSELQSLMRNSYAVFCLKKKN